MASEAAADIAPTYCKIMKIIPIAVLGALLACSTHSLSQTSGGASPDLPQNAPAAGAIIMPPATDPGMVRKPPENVDPGVIAVPPPNIDPDAVERPPTDANPRGTNENKGGSENGVDPGSKTTPSGASGQKTPTGVSGK